MTAILKITDGTISVDLLGGNGLHLNEWRPRSAEPKGGGVFADNPMSDERRLVQRARQSIVDTFDLNANGPNQDALIQSRQDLRRLLERAADYWLEDWNTAPVWIEAKASCETNSRYAVVMQGSIAEDDNPFSAPFLQPRGAASNGLSLVVEHQIWRSDPPGSSTCIPLTTQQSYLTGANLVNNPGFETLGGGGLDTFADWTELRYPAGDTYLIADTSDVHAGAHACRIYSTLPYGSGYVGQDSSVYESFSVTPGEVITVSFWAHGDGYMAGRYAVALNAPSSFTPFNNYLVPPTTTGVPGTAYVQVSFQISIPAGVDTIFLMLMGPPADYGGADDIRQYRAFYDDVSVTRPASVTGLETGDLCSEWRFIVEKSVTATLTHVYVYDAAPAGWSANLFGAALPYNLLPAAPAVGDITYFGIEQAGGVNRPFNNVIFDVGTASSGVTVIWEWYNGAAWVTFTGTDYTGNTPSAMASNASWSKLGVGSVAWDVRTTWTACNLLAVLGAGAPNVTGYWIRARVSAAVAPVSPAQRNMQVYCSRNAWVDISPTVLSGDIPALCKLLVYNREYLSAANGGLRHIERLLVGSRRIDRGDAFTAYLNLDGTQNSSGVSITTDASTAVVADVRAPTGQDLRYTPGGIEALTHHYTLTVAHPLSAQYRGRYRVFVTHRGATTTNSFQVRALLNDAVVWTSAEVHWFGGTSLFDSEIGILDLTFPGLPASEFGSLAFKIYFSSDTGAGASYLQSLVLFPVDEWTGDIVLYPSAMGDTTYMVIDSADSPKVDIRANSLISGTRQFHRKWQVISNGPFTVKTSGVQRLWFYFGVTSGATTADLFASVELYAVNRYLTSRGAR